jgi:hypothetical protein
MAQQPLGGLGLIISRLHDHTLRHTTVGRTPLDEWSARRRDLYLTTHNTHNIETSMPPGGIRTRNPSKRATADPRLRPHGQWDRQNLRICKLNAKSVHLCIFLTAFDAMFNIHPLYLSFTHTASCTNSTKNFNIICQKKCTPETSNDRAILTSMRRQRVNMSQYTSWRRMGEIKYSSTHYEPRH